MPLTFNPSSMPPQVLSVSVYNRSIQKLAIRNTMAEEHIIQAHCNGCRHTTNHRVLKSRNQSGSDEEQGFHWETQYDMLECCGCEEVTLRRIRDTPACRIVSPNGNPVPRQNPTDFWI